MKKVVTNWTIEAGREMEFLSWLVELFKKPASPIKKENLKPTLFVGDTTGLIVHHTLRSWSLQPSSSPWQSWRTR